MIRAECQHCREQLDDYLSSELLVETTREVLLHTSGCADCREELERRQALRHQLRRAIPSDLPDSIEPRLLAALTAAQQAASAVTPASEVGVARAPSQAVGKSPRRHQLGKVLKQWGHKLSAQGRAVVQPSVWPSGARQAVGVVALCLVGVAGFWYFGVETRVSAAELLQRSTNAERALLVAPNVSLHRVLTLEERSVASGLLIRRRRIEIWRDNQTGMTARRAFTDANQLVAGEWTGSGGDGTVYRRGASPQPTSSSSVQARAGVLVTSGEAWRLGMTAEEFAALVPAEATADVKTTPTEYEVSFVNASPDRDNPIRRASVTLTRPDLHPVRQVLLVEAGEDSREYRLAEHEFATVPLQQVAQAVFAPDAELTWLVATPLDVESPLLMPRGVRRVDAHHFEVPQIEPALEIDVLYRLHRIDACLHERAEVLRGDDGVLTVRAVAPSEYRHSRIVDALAPFAANSSVAIEVTLDTLAPVPEVIAPPLASRTAMPGYEPLRRYFLEYVLRRLPPDQHIAPDDLDRSIDEAIDRLAARIRDRAALALRHAEALRTLVNRFDTPWPAGADLNTVATLQTMLRDHARAFRHETEAVRLELQPVFFAAAPLEQPPAEVGGPEAPNLRLLVEQMLAAALLNQEAVLASFPVDALDRTKSGVESVAFWRSLLLCEGLSAEFERPWTLEKDIR